MYCENCSKEVEKVTEVHRDSLNLDNYFFVCDDCLTDYWQCQCCNHFFEKDEIHIFSLRTGEFKYCHYCKDRNFSTCQVCGNLGWKSELRRNREGLELCPSCYQDQEQFIEIRSYNFKPQPIFHIEKSELGKRKKKIEFTGLEKIYPEIPFFGIELETDGYSPEGYHDCLNDLNDLDKKEKNFYCKHDGSLDRGIEIVFHPRSLNSWYAYRDELKEIMDICLGCGGKSYNTSTCGCHVHRSNGDIADWHKTKIISVFCRMKPWIEKVAQRKENLHYASFRYFEDTVDNYDYHLRQKPENRLKLLYKAQKKGECLNRYVAVNIANKKTVEYRVFRGSLKVDSVLAYIYFSDSITLFSKSIMFFDLLTADPVTLWNDYKNFARKLYKNGPGKDLLEEYFLNKKI